MTENQARTQLRQMLRTLTAGSVLHLMAEIFRADRITADHLRRACELEGTDALGLGPTDQQYLMILAGGPTRLNVVASRLGLPGRTVAEVVEPFLIRAGLVCKDDQGRRELTPEGREHLLAQRRSEAV